MEEVARALPSHHRPGKVRIALDPLPRTRLGMLRRHKLEELFQRLGEDDAVTEAAPEPIAREAMAHEDQQLLSDPAAAVPAGHRPRAAGAAGAGDTRVDRGNPEGLAAWPDAAASRRGARDHRRTHHFGTCWNDEVVSLCAKLLEFAYIPLFPDLWVPCRNLHVL